jgi:hypothetical protein
VCVYFIFRSLIFFSSLFFCASRKSFYFFYFYFFIKKNLSKKPHDSFFFLSSFLQKTNFHFLYFYNCSFSNKFQTFNHLNLLKVKVPLFFFLFHFFLIQKNKMKSLFTLTTILCLLVAAFTTFLGVFATAKHILKLKNDITPCIYNVASLEGVSNDIAYAASAAAGLMNRGGAIIFLTRGSNEQEWQNLILNPKCQSNQITPTGAILSAVATWNKIILYDGLIEWNYTLPSVTTMAGVLNAVPLSNNLYNQLSRSNPADFKNSFVVLNTTGMWKDIYEATNFTLINAISKTSGMAFAQIHSIHTGALVDLIVGAKYFAHYLPNACIPFTPGNALLEKIVAAAPWPRPIGVIGYNGQDALFGGDLFEAETDCFSTNHSMGQIASSGCQNLFFWSEYGLQFNASSPRGSPTGPLNQPGPTGMRYDATKKYVALTYGDMDNLDFVQTFGRTHMRERVQWCKQNKSSCFPFTWTLSPHLIELAPEMMRWYYETAAGTGGLDSFIMPPSGYLYSYGGQMPSDVQALYVEKQNAAANIMSTTGSIHWEWFFQWERAYETYFPRYIGNSPTPTTKNFFLLSVPWPVPEILGHYTWWVGNKTDPSTNVFTIMKQFVWQKGGGGGLNLTPLQAAQKIEAFQVGSINYVYIIQNTPVHEVFEAVANITDPSVVLVSYSDLGDLARQKAVLEEAEKQQQQNGKN